ncbi:MAG TPA: hypothetical protein PLS03_00170 [Terrimicrobiaceae bacterium]|nr:hypothetical protein [Terrimicrobiaceae bacterium]
MFKRVAFTSSLPTQHRGRLEEIFFFNPHQGRLREQIIRSVEKHGNPEICERNGSLCIAVAGVPEAQCLYALSDGKAGPLLVGVVVFNRSGPEALEILHIAADENFGLSGRRTPVGILLVEELLRIARQIHGIKSLHLPYGRGTVKIKEPGATGR